MLGTECSCQDLCMWNVVECKCSIECEHFISFIVEVKGKENGKLQLLLTLASHQACWSTVPAPFEQCCCQN